MGVPLQPAKRDFLSGGTSTERPESVRIPEGSLLPDDPKIRETLVAAAERHKINPALLFAMAHQESRYNPEAVGPDTKWGRAEGMFQFLNSTAKAKGIDPRNYEQAANAAAQDLAEQIVKNGMEWAVAHHHAGPNPKLHGEKTRKYVQEVLAKAEAIAKELGLEFKSGQAVDFSNVQSGKTEYSLEEVLGEMPTAAPTESAPKSEEESFTTTLNRRLAKDMAESGIPIPTVAAAVQGVRRSIARGWEGIQNALNREVETVVLSPQEAKAYYEAMPWYDRPSVDVNNLTEAQRTIRVAKKPSSQEEAEWIERLKKNPGDAYLLPKRLAHLRPQEDDSKFAPANTFKGAMQRIVAGHKSPMDLLLQDSIPANAVTYLITLPETERQKFDQVRIAAKAMDIRNNPEASPEERQWADEALSAWEEQTNPTVKKAWNALYDAAKTNPGQIGLAFSEALFADPYMVAAPAGVGMKPIRTAQKLTTGVSAATTAGRAAKIADAILDGTITTAGLNVTAGALENLATTGTVNQAEVKLNAAMGALFGGALAPIFMRGAKAKARLHETDKLRAEGLLEETLQDAAKADVALESAVQDLDFGVRDPDFGIGAKETEVQKRIREMFGIRTKQDAEKFIQQRRKEIEEVFKNESDYADYLNYVAEEKLNRAAELAAAAEAKAAAKQAADDAAATRAANYREEWQRQFDAAIEARNAAEDFQKDLAWQKHEEAQAIADKLNAEELAEALYTGDHPTIKQTEAKINRRNSALRTPKWQRGSADTETLAALGITAAGAAAGAAMFPNDKKKGMVAGAILSGLSVLGLSRARGSKGRLGAPSVISQQGAIKPKGGNWSPESVKKLAPPVLDSHANKITERYLQRYAGTSADPLKDLVLPDGTRWEDAMDLAIRGPEKDSYGGDVYRIGQDFDRPETVSAVHKLRSYMNHVSDYLRTLPESEVLKMDFVRMVKETKRWDEANARKMEKAHVKFFKDAEVLKEYDDGFKWIRLNKPGQFANESDLMGHSVRGYEPAKFTLDGESFDGYHPDFGFDLLDAPIDELRKAFQNESIDINPDWLPESIGGDTEYGYGGWDAIKNDQARVYSLRGPNGKPVATVELGRAGSRFGDAWEISQIKGPRNEPVKEKYYPKVADFIQRISDEYDLLHVLEYPPGFPEDIESFSFAVLRNQAGKASPEDLARLGVVAGGAAAGFALFPEDEKLQGTLLGGLAGLIVPAGGSVLSRMRQAGAISSDGQIIAALTKAGKLVNKLDEAEIKARDTAWMDQAKAGDQQGFAQLYDAYFNRIKRFAQKFTANREDWLGLDAEDIAQMAFVKAFRKLQDDPEFKIDNFPAFVTTIAENEAKNALTARTADMRGGDTKIVSDEVAGGRDAYEGDPTSGYSRINEYAGAAARGEAIPYSVGTENILDTPEAVATRDQTLDIIRQALSQVDEGSQRIFTLVHLEHYTLEEAAEIAGISKSGAWHQLRRAENRIAENIAKNKLKYGAPANQRGSASPEDMTKLGIITAAAAAGGTAGYFLYDGDPWKTAVSAGFTGAGGAGLAMGGKSFLSKVLRGVDYRLKEFGPELYGLAKRHGYQELKGIREFNNSTADFITMFEALPKDLKPTLIEALSTRDRNIIDKMLNHLGGRKFVEAFDKVRKKLDEVEDQLVSYGLIKKSEKDYFPFRVKDLEGLKKELGTDFADEINTALAAAEKKIKEKAGREMTEIERAIVVNKVMEPYLGKPLGPQRPGFSKARTIQRIPEKLQKYYHDPVETLNSYGVQAIKYIERAKFFGKHLVKKKEGNQEFVDVSNSIGELVDSLRKKDQLTDQQVFELKNLLQDRFGGGEKGTSRFISGMKNIVNAALLGHVASAAVQLGDIALQAAVQGPRASIKALKRQFTRSKLRKLDDFGLNEHVAHEFLSDGWTRKLSDWSFKWGGFRAIDATGKNFGINASIERMMKDAQTPQGQMKLAERYQRYFPEEYPKALAALKKGEVNDAVELLAFTDLTKTQPLTQWELPQFYHKLPNGRVIYHLQTFSIRVMNLVYEEAIKDIISGNAKRAAAGTKRLFALGAVLGVQGVATDKIKDALAGKPIELSFEEIPINALEALGLSLYDYNRIADKGPVAGFAESKLPPIIRMSNDLLNEPERSIRYVPVAGRAAYDFFREDLEAHRKERRRAQGYKMEIRVPAKPEAGRSERKRPERKRSERSR